MAYGDFDLKTAAQKFGLSEDRNTDLVADVEPLEPSDFLRVWLNEFAPVALGVNSEKARSEFIIAPILAEGKRRSGATVTILPGVTFEVDKERRLTGFCDFLRARSPEFSYVREPILAVVEAKREDLVAGLGQCAAEMVASQLFNENEGDSFADGVRLRHEWEQLRFLELEGKKLFIDRPEYYLRDAAKILGILVSIARG